MAKDYRQAIVIKITKGGDAIFEGCYGTNTKAYGVKPDTIFQVASVTKPVVATLLMMLQEDGLVDLYEPVSTYLPEFTGGGRENIQLWHFLTHTSSLRYEDMQPYIDEICVKEYRLLPPKEGSPPEEWQAFRRLACEKMGLDPDAINDRLNDPEYLVSLKIPIKHAPRSNMAYCNYGYQRLKEIIDVVTGEPIDTTAQKRLFDPLGMKDTYWSVPEEKWGRILGRKEVCEGAAWLNSTGSYQDESGAGGLKTTVDDITNFCRMILGGGVFHGERLLSRRSVAEMARNHNAGVASDGNLAFGAWGLGWNIKMDKQDDTGILRSSRCLDHGGWAGTKILIDPEEGITAAIFTAEYKPGINKNIYAPVMNVLYSALE